VCDVQDRDASRSSLRTMLTRRAKHRDAAGGLPNVTERGVMSSQNCSTSVMWVNVQSASSIKCTTCGKTVQRMITCYSFLFSCFHHVDADAHGRCFAVSRSASRNRHSGSRKCASHSHTSGLSSSDLELLYPDHHEMDGLRA
jgi:hypothetical protein